MKRLGLPFRRVSLGTVVTTLSAVLLIVVGWRVVLLGRAAGAGSAQIEREQAAVQYDRALRPLLAKTVSPNPTAGTRAAARREVQYINALAIAGSGILDIRPKWRAVQQALAGGTPSSAIRPMQSLWSDLLDRSDLQYDTNRFAQNYASVAFAKIPAAIVDVSASLAYAAPAVSQGEISIPNRINLAYLVNRESSDFDITSTPYTGTIANAYVADGNAFRDYVTSHVLDPARPAGNVGALQKLESSSIGSALAAGNEIDGILLRGLDARAQFLVDQGKYLYALVFLGAALLVGLTLLIIEMGSRRTRQDLARVQQESERLTAELARQRAERALRLSEAQFRAIFDGAAVGIGILGRDGTILDSNSVFRAVFGTGSVGLLRGHEAEFAALARGERELFEFEQHTFTPEGQEAWTDCTFSLVKDDNGKPYFAICMFRDVTDLKRTERRMQHERTHDSLTGLPNRLLFEAELREQLANLRTSARSSFAVYIIDLDRFREINEAFGHESGDFVISQVAQRLGTAVSSEDVVARVGSDQFAILSRSLNDVLHLEVGARHYLSLLSQPMSVGTRSVYVSASVGIAVGSTKYIRADDIMRDAEIATRNAKSAGGSRIATFDSRMHARAEKRLQLTADLRAALDRNDLFLLYQPIVNIETGEFTGCEALLRWSHKEEGVLTPADFLPLAEQAGLSTAIGKAVLRIACEQLRNWDGNADVKPFTVNLNVSWADLIDHDFEQSLNAMVAEYEIDPSRITLEIMENVVLDPGGKSVQLVERLRNRGFGICIDDFGTGYSSLRYLQQFKIDSMKIDRSFVCGQSGDVASEPIVRTLMTLAKAFDVAVVAEGIETQRQLDVLREAGCVTGQGYYFARPLTPAELAQKYPGVFQLASTT